jgi:hypothetical protein
VRSIGVEERRARLALRHGLTEPTGSPEEATEGMVALHSSDPVSPFLSAWARIDGFATADLEAALYDRRSLVRMLGMRRTLFVVSREMAALMNEACTKALIPAERARLVGMLEAQGIAREGRGAAWLDRVVAATLEALTARGEASARELTTDVPELGQRLMFGEGKTWASSVGVSTRVLFLLAGEGQAIRARPLGSWISSQYRWATTASWLGGPLPAVDHADACAGLLRRWLWTFGPGTLTDIRWWTGWTARLARETLRAVGAVEVGLDDAVGYVLPDDVGPVGPVAPCVALLPGLDPTVMGWKERAWYVDDRDPRLFDTGNAGPTVWANGRVVGGWVHRPDGEVAVELLEEVDAASRTAIEARRLELREWLGDVRVRSRFPAALERPKTRSR